MSAYTSPIAVRKRDSPALLRAIRVTWAPFTKYRSGDFFLCIFISRSAFLRLPLLLSSFLFLGDIHAHAKKRRKGKQKKHGGPEMKKKKRKQTNKEAGALRHDASPD